jgi:hypothetical protein
VSNCFEILDIIVCGDFCQVPPTQDATWIITKSFEGLNRLAPNFWQEKIKCYELHSGMHQNDMQHIKYTQQISSSYNKPICI